MCLDLPFYMSFCALPIADWLSQCIQIASIGLGHIERARKLGARNYDGIGDPEKAWSWLEGNERVFNVMGCFDEHIVTD